MNNDLSILQNAIGIQFINKVLLQNVFVHRSYLNEHRTYELPSNEKFEFLGDSVLSLATSIYLYHNYPDLGEGDYTDIKASIVRTESLAEAAQKLNLGNYLLLSHGEEKGGGRTKVNILADAFEALIAAVFIDRGFDTAFSFIEKYLFTDKLDHIVKNKLYLSPKSHLQEITQAKFKNLPTYEIVQSTGPEHKKNFTVAVFVNNDKLAEATGKSKKQAEELAAQIALDKLIK